MASLYKSFRKNRKMWFALLTLMCMLSFVFIPAVIDIAQYRGVRDPLVASSEYGKIKQSDLQALLHQRRIVRQFLEGLSAAVMQARGQGAEINAVLGAIGPYSEKSVVESWLLRHKALELGMTVTDQSVNSFVQRASENKVSDRQLQEMLSKRRISHMELFDALRNELLAAQLREMARTPLTGLRANWIRLMSDTTPGERWDYFLRLNRSARIEAVPVDVADFVAEVGDPSEKQVVKLFDDYKNREPDRNSPEPGFREPHRVDIEYLKLDYQKFYKPEEVTDAEVQKYYDANKEFEFKEAEPSSPSPTHDVTPPAKPDTAKPEGKSESTTDAKTESKPQPEPKSEPKPATPTAPAKKPESGPAAAPAKEPAKTSSSVTASPFRFASYQAKDTSPPAAAGKPEASKPETSKPEASKPEASKPEASKPETSKPAESAKPEKSASAKPDVAAQPKYQPLEKVKSQIRGRLAHEKAMGQLRTAVQSLEDKMRRYHEAWLNFEAIPEDQRSQHEKPERPNLRAMADELKQPGVSVGQTGLVSAQEMEGADIAQSYFSGGRMEGRRSFNDIAFSTITLFQPLMTEDDGGSRYLFWKAGEDKPEEPKLGDEEVHAKVVQAWKVREARDLAKKEAERIAEEARSSSQPLRKLFAGQSEKRVLEPAPFSWMRSSPVRTMGSLNPPELSKVEAIDGAGPRFMRAVFALEPGAIGVASNQPESVFYVVRLAEYSPSQKVLLDRFFGEGPLGEYLLAKMPEIGRSFEAWMEEIKTEAELRWEREPVEARGYED